jgi:class 3 adenylate cyclase
MTDPALNIARLRAALAEVFAQRDVFSNETYTQIVMALYDRIRVLQTQPTDNRENDEIRLVTVVFMDVVDSTEMARRLQAENWKQIISDAHVLLSQIVRNWGGDVGQYLGDGLL